jgi:L,D-peptidoglycan transpeptidase YkuD (ErfK/YbiS/YcfS/YnhG family)
MRPVIKNKGSAIFIHVANNNYNPTRGCVALSKIDLLKILNNINKRTKVKIG